MFAIAYCPKQRTLDKLACATKTQSVCHAAEVLWSSVRRIIQVEHVGRLCLCLTYVFCFFFRCIANFRCIVFLACVHVGDNITITGTMISENTTNVTLGGVPCHILSSTHNSSTTAATASTSPHLDLRSAIRAFFSMLRHSPVKSGNHTDETSSSNTTIRCVVGANFGGRHKLEVNVRDRGLAVGASSHGSNNTVSLAVDVIPMVRLMFTIFIFLALVSADYDAVGLDFWRMS